MGLYEQIVHREQRVCVIGLGYAGLPVAVAFAGKADVVGFDIDEKKIGQYRGGHDPTGQVGDGALKNTSVRFTCDPAQLKGALFFIIAVPTPLGPGDIPDLSPLAAASGLVGGSMAPGAVVVYESTGYPGMTEEFCVPILEKASGLTCGADFFVGYSPERLSPGDGGRRLETVVKLVAAMDEATLDTVAQVYGLVAGAGVYRAESIRVAEAAKVIENCQRDVNIALMNELSTILGSLGLDTKSVLEAASTKWNFLDFHPGLVGGHCVGVDPLYLTYKAQQLGCRPQLIPFSRRINDGMGRYVAGQTIEKLRLAGVPAGGARVAVLGLTYKENVADTRNTRVADMVAGLRAHGAEPLVADPLADPEEVCRLHGLHLTAFSDIRGVDAVILAVAHDAYRALGPEDIDKLFKNKPEGQKVLMDVRGIVARRPWEAAGRPYWSL